MPKLEEYNNDGFQNPVSAAAAQKLANSPSLGGTTVNIDYAASVKATADAAAVTTAGGADTKVELDKDAQDWVNKKWRPMMGWMYMATCTFDFILAPVLWSIVQALGQGQVSMQWQPLTLQGAGLYHVAMGAVLGIAAYGRTKEKLENKT
jgi:hypothetical protein